MKSSGCGLSGFWKLFDAFCDGHRPTKDKSHIERRVFTTRYVEERETSAKEEDSRSGGFKNATRIR